MIRIFDKGADLSEVFRRSQFDFEDINAKVRSIVSDVRQRGDAALFEYTSKFDKISLTKTNITVSEDEFEAAFAAAGAELVASLTRAKQNIYDYHSRQKRSSDIRTDGGRTTGYMVRPVSRAGIYVPGGKAAYPSSVLMCALPALVAGVGEIIMCTPGSNINPLTLVAARLSGISKVYKVGGAQAIAAMAYGTESVPKADVISGPGNIYVALAKREVFGQVGIDMVAGPSEILIVADETADPEFLAADLLSQAEHDELAVAVLVTTSAELAIKTRDALSRRIKLLGKCDIASKSISDNGAIIVTDSIGSAIDIANKIAPEHLELAVKDPEKYLDRIVNAGAVFLGHFSPEPLGDYYAGPNHVLPTSGTARHFSALGVDNYIKKISVVGYDKNSLFAAKDDIIRLAECERLDAHAQSVRVRFTKE